MTDVLKTVTDRFCLYSNARKGRQNGRQYVLSAVKTALLQIVGGDKLIIPFC